ncbi:hypothetical protein BsWGS_03642 [Bradybaena similaris]
MCLISCLTASVNGAKTWSKWYDGRLLNGTNNGTLDRIRELFSYDCDDIDSVECSTKSWTTNETTTTTWPDTQYFRLPCDASVGNICMLISRSEWGLAIPCRDFDIRFLCQTSDPPKTDTPVPDTLTINGGFIAMAAGLSVVVPLICVLVMQLRRAKREERERDRERRRTEAGGAENGATDLPPSYEQVFGQNYHSVAPPVHSRNSSMDALIEEDETRNAAIGSQPSETYVAVLQPPGILSSSLGGLANSQVTIEGPRANPGYSEAPLATISGSHVADIAGPSGVNILLSSGSWDSTDHPSQTPAGLSADRTPSSSSPPPPPPPPSTSSSPPPAPPPPPPPRSPPPPFSSWSFRNSSSNRNNGSGNVSSHLQETLRRLPGMHLSIEDFFASLRGLHDNENEGPPPSYEEALKILELAALAKESKNIIT